jgi:hypothetical protein
MICTPSPIKIGTKHIILPIFVHQMGREAHDLYAVANQQSVARRCTQVELVGWLPTVNKFMICQNLANQNWNKGLTSQSKLE